MRRLPLVLLTAAAVALLAVPGRGQPASGRITAEQLQTSAKNLERIALAMHNYHDALACPPTCSRRTRSRC